MEHNFFWGEMSEEEFYTSEGVKNEKEFFTTPNGNGQLFTQSWLSTTTSAPKGLVFCTHGYGNDTSWMFQTIPMAFARWGYAAFASDLLGHGRSDGLHGYIADAFETAKSQLAFFRSVRNRPEYSGLPAFLFGESMGGGLTFLMLLLEKESSEGSPAWDGAILSAPLLVIPEPMKPSRVLLFAYGLLGGLAESWAVLPATNRGKKSVKDPAKGKKIAANPRRYTGKPRVGTMRQLGLMCNTFAERCGEITTPFLVLHGTSDEFASPEGSEALYERAASSDKTMKLYDGMYHSLLQGERDENIERVLGDIREWIDTRSSSSSSSNTAIAIGHQYASSINELVFGNKSSIN